MDGRDEQAGKQKPFGAAGNGAAGAPTGRWAPPAILGARFVAPAALARLDERIVRWTATHALTVLRLALGIIFLWYGALKFFPGYSPAEALAGRTIHDLTFGVIAPEVALRVLAAWETLIGLGLLVGRWLRITLLLLALQLPGTFLPLLLYPDEIWYRAPFSLTIEGQYIAKNVVLLGAALVLAATVRGGHLVDAVVDRGANDGTAPPTSAGRGAPESLRPGATTA